MRVTSLFAFACLGLMAGSSIASAQIVFPSCKSVAVSDCSTKCGINGPCIFGCEIGQFGSADQCSFECTGVETPQACLDACMSTLQVISQCPVSTSNLTVQAGAATYNRGAQVWVQNVVITNTGTTTQTNLGYAVGTLGAGWTLINDSGPGTLIERSLSPYVAFGSLGPNESVVVTLLFHRVGTTAIQPTGLNIRTPLVFALPQ